MKIKSLVRNGNCPICRGTGKIHTTDWLTKGLSEEELAREKEEALDDIVEVVRCKDCIHSATIHNSSDGSVSYHCKKSYGLPEVDPTDYCSHGERREG